LNDVLLSSKEQIVMERFFKMISIELATIRMDEALDSFDEEKEESPDKPINRNSYFYYRKNPENN